MGKRHPRDCNCYDCVQKWAMRRYEAQRSGGSSRESGGGRPSGRGTYGRGSTSGAFGRSSYSMTEGTFDGYPSLWFIRDDGAKVIYYGPAPVHPDQRSHGHAVILKGRLIYKRRPGEETPIVNRR